MCTRPVPVDPKPAKQGTYSMHPAPLPTFPNAAARCTSVRPELVGSSLSCISSSSRFMVSRLPSMAAQCTAAIPS